MGPGVKNCVRQKTPIKCNNPLTVHRLYSCQIPWYHAHLFTLRRIEYVTHSHFYNLECTSSELIQVFQNRSGISESFQVSESIQNFRMPFYFQNVALSFRIALAPVGHRRY